jgi:hypothetical protein
MHLIPAGIIEFPKKEIYVTQDSRFVPTKIDFLWNAIAQKGNDRHMMNLIKKLFFIRFGRNYDFRLKLRIRLKL